MSWSLTVLGGGEEIGANAYLLRIDGLSFLLDAGLHPKKYGQESLPDFLEKPFDVHGTGHVHGLMAEFPQGPAYRLSLNKGIGLIGMGSFFRDSIV